MNTKRNVLLALACGLLLLGSAGVFAADEPDRSAALEEAFWACDYIGTTQGVAEAPVAFCLDVTHALQRDRFGDDFDALVAWWRDNKAAQHARLAAQQTSVVRRAAGQGA